MAGGNPIDLARVFKALGDPTRLAIYETVRDAVAPDAEHSPTELRNSVSQIARRFDISPRRCRTTSGADGPA
jgi:DNA-binding transcriptional ArsR family regulator